MFNCNLPRKLMVFTVLVCHSVILARGSEPGMTGLPREIELEQRLMHLEAILSSEGCAAPVQEYAQCNAESSIYAGYRFLFVKPQMKESFEATIINPVAGQTTLIPLDYSFNVTPNVWLGYRTNQSVGMRVSYWGFNNDGNNQILVSDGVNLPGATATTVIYPAAIIAPAPGDVLQTQNSLKVHTIDAEGTVDHRIHATDLTFGAGLRFASTSQEMHALASRVGVPIGQLGWSRKFEGLGPTLSATATHPIVGGLSAVGNVRGSLLYGQKNLNRTVAGDVTPAPVAGSPTVSLNNADEVVAAGELGIGLRYTTAISHQTDFYVQGTLDGQLWTDAGAPTLTFLGFQGIGLALGIAF